MTGTRLLYAIPKSFLAAGVLWFFLKVIIRVLPWGFLDYWRTTYLVLAAYEAIIVITALITFACFAIKWKRPFGNVARIVLVFGVEKDITKQWIKWTADEFDEYYQKARLRYVTGQLAEGLVDSLIGRGRTRF